MSTESVVSLILQGQDNASPVFGAVQDSAAGLDNFMKLSLAGGFLAVAGSVAAVGAAAFNFSEEVDGAMRTVEAQTGLTGDALADFEEQAKDVFQANWGEDFSDVADAMATVRTITQEAGDELENLTTNALIVRDVFGEDVNASTDAAKTLMDQFGVSGADAFDLITFGMQNGMNRSGDFLDTIGEYSNLFADAGFSAEEMFSIISSGAEGGVLGTDKIADAVKEFQIRFTEGGDDVAAAIEQLTGDSWQMFIDEIQSGDRTVSDTFNLFTDLLGQIEDPIERNRLQVALFGTQAEDLGASFTEGLDPALIALDDVRGATEAAGDAVSAGLGPAWQSFSRGVLVALEPLGDAIGGVLEAALPHLERLGEWIAETVPAVMEFFSQLGERLDSVGSGAFARIGEAYNLHIAPVWEGIRSAWENDIKPPLDALGLWFEETFPGAAAFFSDFWENTLRVVFEAIVTYITDYVIPIWGGIGRVITDDVVPAISTVVAWLSENLPPAIETAREMWGILTDAVTVVVDTVQNLWDRLTDFWDWLTGLTFDINFSWPELPDWLMPGSPIKFHTLLMDMHQWMESNPMRPKIEAPDTGVLDSTLGVMDQTAGQLTAAAAAPTGSQNMFAPAAGGGTTYMTINVNDPGTGNQLLELVREMRQGGVVLT